MSNHINWGAVVTVGLAAAWALAILWRLSSLLRQWPTLGVSSPHPQLELALRLGCGIAVLAFAVGYVVIALLRGPTVPYAWMGAHPWVLLVLFVANSVVFAVVVFPTPRNSNR